MTQSIEIKVKNRIYGKGKGWCFTPSHFFDLGNRDAIHKALSNLQKKGTIRRLSFGLYDYPKKHEKLGELPPDLNSVAKAISENLKVKLQPSGAYAANLLGLSEQIPTKVTFLTNGSPSKITIGNREIILKQTTTKNMQTAGTISGIVIQALRYIGKDHVDSNMIQTLKKRLNKADKKRLQLDAPLAPAWISEIIQKELN